MEMQGDNKESTVRNQIDYVLIDKPCKNGIKGITTYCSDIGSNHNSTFVKLEIPNTEKEFRK